MHEGVSDLKLELERIVETRLRLLLRPEVASGDESGSSVSGGDARAGGEGEDGEIAPLRPGIGMGKNSIEGVVVAIEGLWVSRPQRERTKRKNGTDAALDSWHRGESREQW
jgi:hypothetical protein